MRTSVIRSREGRLARILWARSLEEEDREGRFLPIGDRRRATRDTRGVEDPLAARAERLVAEVGARRPAARLVPRIATGALPVPLAALGGAALGLALDAIGNRRQVSLLAFPLLGLVAWNLGIYAVSLLRLSLRGRPSAMGLERLLLALHSRAGDTDESAWLSRALARFVVHWRTHLAPLAALRIRAALHAAAAAAGLGIVVGLYVRGFAFEYRATWESTFLDAAEVAALLSTVLAPAAALLGVEVPDADAIAKLRSPADGPAAIWIHLWATTAILVVVLPRAALSAAATVRARRRAAKADLPDDDLYRRRVLGTGDGAVEWAPYAHEPSYAARERIHAALLDLFGTGAPVVARKALRYGDELLTPERPDARLAIVFNLAQTPEREVHGEILERLGAEGGVAVLDAEPFAPVAATGGARLAERLRAWSRACGAAGAGAIVVSPEGTRDL